MVAVSSGPGEGRPILGPPVGPFLPAITWTRKTWRLGPLASRAAELKGAPSGRCSMWWICLSKQVRVACNLDCLSGSDHPGATAPAVAVPLREETRIGYSKDA